MSYVVESGASIRARKRRRTAITLILVIILLAAAFYVAATYYRGAPTRASASGCPSTATTSVKAGAKAPTTTPVKTPARPAALAPAQVTVNVYNGTTRSGLAGDTAKLVRARGFVVGTIANDPLRKDLPGTAEIRFGPNGAAAGGLVATLVAGSAAVKDARADASVDLVLGEKFTALAPAAVVPSTSTTPTC
ncbi:MAG: LytR C-terminal domain-containing protein [Lapillicoccus sp.]